MSETRTKAATYAVASAAICLAGIGAASLLRAPFRGPAVSGAVAASAGALCAFVALVRSAGKGTNALLAGFTVGFLCRAALIAAGMVLAGVRDNLALVYVAAFFVLYAATQVIEVLFVHASRPQGATP